LNQANAGLSRVQFPKGDFSPPRNVQSDSGFRPTNYSGNTLPVSTAKIKNNWSYISFPTFALVSCAGSNFTLRLYYLLQKLITMDEIKKSFVIFSCRKIIQI